MARAQSRSTITTAVLAVFAMLVALLTVPADGVSAAAESGTVVFIKDHNVWIMAADDPDGQRAVTTDGTAENRYHAVTQDDRGVIYAVDKDGHGLIQTLDQQGRPLDAPFRAGTYARIEHIDVAPGGQALAIASAEFCGTGSTDPNNPGANQICSKIDVLRTDGPQRTIPGDYFPTWWSDDRLVLTDVDSGNDQALGYYRLGMAQESDWFDLCSGTTFCFPEAPAVTRQVDRLASPIQELPSLNQPARLQIYDMGAPPPTAPTIDCVADAPPLAGEPYPGIFKPTWSPDGDGLVWTLGPRSMRGPGFPEDPPEGAGLYMARGFAGDCEDAFATAELVAPGATMADWSAAPLGATPPVIGPPTTDGEVTRLWGQDRFETAIAVSTRAWEPGGADAVMLARADDFADALAGTPLAVARRAPMLITNTGDLDDRIADEIRRVLGSDRTRIVYLLGGTAALSPTVEAQVEALGYRTERIAGDDRIRTAIAIAEELGPVDRYFITTGHAFPDALAAGPAAVVANGAVLLTTSESRAAATDAYMDAHPDVERIAVGGPAARPYPEALALFGSDREATAVAVAEEFFPAPSMVAVARSDNYPDALTGGAHIAAVLAGGPMLLTPTGQLSPAITSYLCARHGDVDGAFAYGGTMAIGAGVVEELGALVRGEGCS